MKFTLSWLKEHLETDATLEEISQTLTMIGLEVDEIVDKSEELKDFIVGEVLSVRSHPDADRLNICEVSVGNRNLQVVCGANNVEKGMKGVFAGENVYVPGTDMLVKKSTIRNVASEGMLCSERELQMSDDHDGIIHLDQNAKAGEGAIGYLGLDDPMIDIDITPNRGDCLGVRGIARDLAAAGLGTLKPLETHDIKSSFSSPVSVSLDFDENQKNACPYFALRVIKGVTNQESPEWLKKKLLSIGLKPISALVDITNYLTFDQARPLHVFDYDKIAGNFKIRMSREGESLAALNDESYELSDDMVVIADDMSVLSLGGIIGGETTSCTDKTTNVVLECALFDSARIALTGRKLNVESDARYRFERGVDPASVQSGLDQATKLILDICGGEVSDISDAGNPPAIDEKISLRPERFEKLIGVEFDHKKDIKILENLGFDVKKDGKKYNVQRPSWRYDVSQEIDLFEEIIRIRGYDTLPEKVFTRDKNTAFLAWSPLQSRRNTMRRELAHRGLLETVTWSFLSREDAEKFDGNVDGLEILNPISQDLSVMRPSILPHLLRAVKKNLDRGLRETNFFEIGPSFITHNEQKLQATGLRAGLVREKNWQVAAREVDLFDAKADLLTVLGTANLTEERLRVVQGAASYYHPGRSGTVFLGKALLGYFGEIHPSIAKSYGLKEKVVGFEVNIENLPPIKQKKNKNKAPLIKSQYQPVERDFAFILDQKVAADQVLKAIRSAEKKLLTNVVLFDVYQGKGVEEGKKSIALSVTLQSDTHTLTEDEIEQVSSKIVAQVNKQTNAVLRA